MLNIDMKTCFGCTACESICPNQSIIMSEKEEGFLYPVVDSEKCLRCGLCEKVCPALNPYDKHDKWLNVFALQHREVTVRANSASGGAFTALSNAVLEENGVIYGVVYNDNFEAEHIRVTTREGRDKMRGSKYVQSKLGTSYRDLELDLKNNQSVLFVGTSCQVDGLLRYLKQRKVDTKALTTCEILCHGVPSPKIWKEHLQYLETKRKKRIVGYTNRSKVKGWHEHNEETEYDDGTREWKTKSSQNFKDLFYKNLILRESCYECPYAGKLNCADFAIGDFWGCEKIKPEIDDNKGTSIVIVNSDKGRAMIEKIAEEVYCWEIPEENCLKYNHYKACKRPEERDTFWSDYNAQGYRYVVSKYAKDTFWGRIKYFIKVRLRRILVKLHIKDL